MLCTLAFRACVGLAIYLDPTSESARYVSWKGLRYGAGPRESRVEGSGLINCKPSRAAANFASATINCFCFLLCELWPSFFHLSLLAYLWLLPSVESGLECTCPVPSFNRVQSVHHVPRAYPKPSTLDHEACNWWSHSSSMVKQSLLLRITSTRSTSSGTSDHEGRLQVAYNL